MALKSFVLSQAANVAKDEEKRNTVIIIVVVLLSLLLVIIFLPLFLILYPLEILKNFFIGDNYTNVENLHNEYLYILETDYLEYKGRFPMPISGVITSEYGMRFHPITGFYTKHNGIDISGVHRDNVIAIEDGIVTMAEIQRGFGNCVEIKHEIVTYETIVDEEGNTETIKNTEIFYSFYAHLSRIDVVEGMKVMQGNVIGLEGGDPKKDPNPGWSTGHHLHFEIRLKSGGNTVDPRNYILNYEAKENDE